MDQLLAALGIELGKDIIQDEHRIGSSLLAQEVEFRQAQRDGIRPRLTVASKALGRLIAQVEHQIIAVRTHQGNAAFDLALPGGGQLGEQHGL